MIAKLFRVEGMLEEIIPANGQTFTLKEMQSYVGGNVQIVELNNENIMAFDEEGKIKGYEMNFCATIIARGSRAIYSTDYIAGDAIVCKSNMFE
ncbi:DUF3846 domain-containing protein [Bacteroides sp.]|uniref:DUF3846 domain-containing protein n=1 Tax=Bacteroides sp. TaxID=29523 RepID=UPI0026294723|nr:DUF3846 domain-containing protein [Bacteroides sp.]